MRVGSRPVGGARSHFRKVTVPSISELLYEGLLNWCGVYFIFSKALSKCF